MTFWFKTYQRLMRFFLLNMLTAGSLYADEFPVLDILQGNVTFWKMIFSEVSLQEGLLHDKEYPMVIYEKLDIRNRSEKDRSNYVDSRRKYFAGIIDSIMAVPAARQTSEHKAISQMFEQYASLAALSGAKDRIRFQLGQKERFREGIERSGLYLDTISAILAKMGLPSRLKYLPHVESSFDHEAYSRVGAAGLWQFMRGTGKMFLTVNYDIDERWDPVKSTEAAAKLLKLNYQTLKAWPAAITAYNHGLGGMKRAVEKTGSNDLGVIIQKHESPSFKFASKNFYASFLAASELADSAEKNFTSLSMHSPLTLKSYTLTERITPGSLCKKLGIGLSDFKTANPAIRPVVYAQNKVLPIGYSIKFSGELPDNRIKQLAKNRSKTEQQDEAVTMDGYYTVKHRDNLHSISSRFSTSVSQLIALNPIANVNKIYVGQVIRLPVTEPSTATDTLIPQEAQNFDTASVQDSTVALSLIDMIGVSDSVQPVQEEKSTLIVDDPAVAVAAAQDQRSGWQLFNADVYDLGLEILPGALAASIRVNTGESVNRYAEWMNVTTKSILKLNEMSSSNLRAGQKLLLPLGARSDIRKFETSRLEFWMAIEEDFFSRYETTALNSRAIKKGENFWKICTIEQIPIWLFQKSNANVDLASLKPGIKIRIPKIRPKTSHVTPLIIYPGDTSVTTLDTMDLQRDMEQ